MTKGLRTDTMVVDEQRAIMVFHGCSNTGQRDQCAFNVAIDRARWLRKRRLRPGEPFDLSDADADFNPAVEVLNGIRDR